MKVCVTGATGFIGFRLVEKLHAQGIEVCCYARPSPRVARLDAIPVRCVTGELTDGEALRRAVRGADVVFHVAGATLVRRAEEFFRVNTEGATAVAQACAAQSSPPVLVFVSSLAASGPSATAEPRREIDPPAPISYYGRSKLAAEMRLQEYHGRLPITIVRPPIVFGPGDTQMLKMFQSVRTGLHLVPTWRRHYFSLIYADDLIDVLQTAASRGQRLTGPADSERRGVYFATAPQHLSYAEMGDLLARSMRDCRRPLKIPVATPVCFLLGLGGECLAWIGGSPSVMNRDKMREATAGSWICSGARAEQELGIRVLPRLEEQFGLTVDWYRQRQWLGGKSEG